MAEPTNRGFTYRERISRHVAGATVLEHLARAYPHSTEAVWRERIEAGLVSLDGARAHADTILAGGMMLEWARPPWVEPDAPVTYAVLHRDEHVLAVDKPSGLPTLPGGGFLENTLLALVRRDVPHAAPVHRLGRWTSGIVLFALTPAARAHLTRALRDGTLWKRYRALASGRPERDRFDIDVPIGPVPHALLGTIHAASPDGRPARTQVHVLERRDGAFLADVVIATGRPHQIRIHLAAAGHPLVGDPLYAPGGIPAPGSTALPGDGGYHLHAAEIRVANPVDRKEMRILALLPPLLASEHESVEAGTSFDRADLKEPDEGTEDRTGPSL